MLELEQQRVCDFAATEETRLVPELHRLAAERSSAKSLQQVGDRIFAVLKKSLAARLADTVESVAEFGADFASERLNELFTGLRALLGLLSSAIASQSQIPRELYAISDWFLEKCSNVKPPPAYALSLDDSFYTEELRQFLVRFFVRPINRVLFPELTTEFVPTPFFLIFLPASTASLSGTLDWPLVFHECVHALEEQVSLVGKFFPALPKTWTELDELAKADDEARKAQQTLEMVCDYVATRVSGPAFTWRFLKEYFSLSGIFHKPSSHPNDDVRVKHLVDLLRAQGFNEQSRLAGELLKEILKDLGNTERPESDPIPSTVSLAEGEYARLISEFDRRSYEKQLKKHCGVSRSKALSDILAKRPVILDPASLFTTVAFSSKCESDPKVAEILADFLRLDRLRARFEASGLTD